jgi:hypothetical protein
MTGGHRAQLRVVSPGIQCVAAVELSVWRQSGTRPSWNSDRCTPLRSAVIDSDGIPTCLILQE